MSNRQEQKNKKAKLTSAHVRESYDDQLQKTQEAYIDERWFSSVEARFDYKQTKRGFLAALPEGRLGRVLEVGPGDGAWTELFADRADHLDVLDQSKEMLARAKKRLKHFTNIEYILHDFLTYELKPHQYDLIVSVRCFEYFDDKKKAIEKMRDALAPGGTIVLITKNRTYKSIQENRTKLLHTEQVGKRTLVQMFRESGMEVQAVYPAVHRWKSSYGVMRFIFDILHRLAVVSKGRLMLPVIGDLATESYVYIVTREKKIVELCGLPGSGKTHLARTLKQKHPGIAHFYPTRRGGGLCYFFLRFPQHALFWVGELCRGLFKRDARALFWFRLAILLDTFEAVGRAHRYRGGIALLEEGLFQRIFSVYEDEQTIHQLRKASQHIPLPDVLLVVDVQNTHFKRYAHPDNPRRKMGTRYLENWKQVVMENYQSTLAVFKDMTIAIHTIRDDMTSDAFSKILSHRIG